jgi:soluble lytic murein transglycosylase-like protein
MKSLLALAAAAWLAAAPALGVAAGVGPAASARRAPSRATVPEWLTRQHEWDAAQLARQTARWGGTLEQIVAASAREAAAESLYVNALATWALGESVSLSGSALPLAAYEAPLRRGTLDLLEHGRPDPAARILDGPLRGDRTMLPVRARVAGLRQWPDSGLALLAWPPDRRVAGPRPIRWDAVGRARGNDIVAGLLAAEQLADSSGNPRARRAALWKLAQEPRPAVKSYARVRLARALVALGEPRLAGQILQQAYGMSDDERLLLANLRADQAGALGDTVWGATQMIDAARDPTLATSARYPLVKRAADWTRGSRADSLDEASWLDLARMLGDVGEGETALSVMKRRHVSASDTAAQVARQETEAAVLLRLKRNQEAASAYEKLLGRTEQPAAARAKYALGLARAKRGSGEFEAMDKAFLQSVALDSTGSTGSVAAWERAREWEDRKTPAEAVRIFSWCRRYVRDATTTQALMAHGAIACIRAGQPDSAYAFIADGYVNLAHYWKAQIATAKGDSARALAEFRQITLADPWSYEGVRAAEEVARRDGKPGGAGSAVKPADVADRQHRASGPSVDPEIPLDARLLGAVGATDLMMDALREGAQSDEKALSRACTDGLEERGVFRVGSADAVPKERLEYPPAYPVAALTSAERESLSVSLLWAIMRQESAYLRDARSKAGALGLLQLLPSTASRLNHAPVTETDLTDPALNVRLGAKYVAGLWSEFGDPRATIAAYNAGEEPVRRWMRDRPKVDDMWVELIPYRETRDYVKQVYTIWRRYEALYGIPPAERR